MITMLHQNQGHGQQNCPGPSMWPNNTAQKSMVSCKDFRNAIKGNKWCEAYMKELVYLFHG